MYSVYLGIVLQTSVCWSLLESAGSIFSWNPQGKRKKANQQLYVN